MSTSKLNARQKRMGCVRTDRQLPKWSKAENTQWKHMFFRFAPESGRRTMASVKPLWLRANEATP
jgi:hypothetical protein